MRSLPAVLILCFASLLQGQAKPTVKWTPQNEVQRTAEAARLSMERDLREVIQIHYNSSRLEDDERKKLLAQQVNDAQEGTAQMKQFAAAVAQAIASDQCVGECRRQIDLLLQHFSAMSETITKLNEQKVIPELLPMEQKTFALRNEAARRCIRGIHLLPKH